MDRPLLTADHSSREPSKGRDTLEDGNESGTKAGRKGKSSTGKRRSSAGGTLRRLSRHFSFKRPEIVINEVSASQEDPSPEKISISLGGNTTYRHSSDDCIRRSSSEVIGGVVFPHTTDSRRGSGMSNSSASLQLHEVHQIEAQACQETEIFV